VIERGATLPAKFAAVGGVSQQRASVGPSVSHDALDEAWSILINRPVGLIPALYRDFMGEQVCQVELTKELPHELCPALQAPQGTEVWVDHAHLRGDNLRPQVVELCREVEVLDRVAVPRQDDHSPVLANRPNRGLERRRGSGNLQYDIGATVVRQASNFDRYVVVGPQHNVGSVLQR